MKKMTPPVSPFLSPGVHPAPAPTSPSPAAPASAPSPPFPLGSSSPLGSPTYPEHVSLGSFSGGTSNGESPDLLRPQVLPAILVEEVKVATKVQLAVASFEAQTASKARPPVASSGSLGFLSRVDSAVTPSARPGQVRRFTPPSLAAPPGAAMTSSSLLSNANPQDPPAQKDISSSDLQGWQAVKPKHWRKKSILPAPAFTSQPGALKRQYLPPQSVAFKQQHSWNSDLPSRQQQPASFKDLDLSPTGSPTRTL